MLEARKSFALIAAPGMSESGIPAFPAYRVALRQALGYVLAMTAQMVGRVVAIDRSDPSWWHRGPMFSEPRLRRVRLGQNGFRTRVFNAYHRRCAITGTKIWPALEAARIRPVAEGGEHYLDNGLLLRSDAHRMFDWGYLGVDPSHRLMVAGGCETNSATVSSSMTGQAR